MISVQAMGICQNCVGFEARVTILKDDTNNEAISTVITCERFDICKTAYNRGVKDALDEVRLERLGYVEKQVSEWPPWKKSTETPKSIDSD